MWSRPSEMSRVQGTWSTPSSSLPFILMVMVAVSGLITTATATSTSAQPVDHNLRLLTSSGREGVGGMLISHPSTPVLPKTRRAREISRAEEDVSPSSPEFRQVSSSAKVKGLYPPLTGSGELLKLFRPLALSPEKTIGMGRWYLPGFGYFSRGGRAASSNFIRFGRSGQPSRFFEEPYDDGSNGGDVTMLSRNAVKKKNNFIRLGRENPRQTNFIRLGRSGPLSPPTAPEFYNSGYITSALSDPFRDDEDGRHEFN